jgi:tetratricopeptide (TPR) repeat protein
MHAELKGILDRAIAAHHAGNLEEAADLVQPVFEAPADAWVPFLTELGERWLASFPDDVPPMTSVILESSLEEAVDALKGGDLAAAIEHLKEAAAYQPRTGNPDVGVVVLVAGWRVEEPAAPEAEPAPEPAAAAEEAAVAPEAAAPPEPQDVKAAPPPPEVKAAPPPPPPTPAAEPGSEWLARGFESLAQAPATALTCFERVIDRAPHLAEAWQGRGRAQMMLGQFEEARAAFEHLLKLTPGDGRAWMAYANALAKLGRMDAARQAHSQALALAPKAGTGPI